MRAGENAAESKVVDLMEALEVSVNNIRAARDASVEGQKVRDALNAHLHRDGVVPCQTACTHDVAPGWTALGVANVIGRLVENSATVHVVEVHVEDGFVRIVCTECDWFVLHDMKAHS